MKFFNWVHKRFHHTLPKDHDDFADDNNNIIKAEKSHVIMVADQLPVREDAALLNKTVLVDALDGWKDGILAIGTFGFDPLKPLIGNPYLVLHSEEDDADTPYFLSDDDDINNENDSDDDSEEDEVNPLIFTSLGNSFKDDGECVVVDEECFSVADDKKNLGRTTLADLFLADADQAVIKKKMMMGKLGMAIDDDDFDEIKYTKKSKAKRGLSFAKKLIPKVKDEASPIKNIQRLMRRMMKRKIHPELLDANSKNSDGQMAATSLDLLPIAVPSVTQSASLLAY